MNGEPVDLDMWCFWLNVSLEPLGYSAHVTPTDPSTWFYSAAEVIRVDDVHRHSPLRGFVRILWAPYMKYPGRLNGIVLWWAMEHDKYGDMADVAFGCIPPVSWIMQEELAMFHINPNDLTPESLVPHIVRIFDAPPHCPGTIWARNKETEMNITYDWSICHEEHQ